MVLFIYRPEYYKIDQDEEGNSTHGMAELIIAKHRNGALADVKLQFIDRFAKFVDYEDDSFADDGTLPSGNDYSKENSYTVPSRMNDSPADDSTPF
jgi:replicative DNA helicase